MKFPIAILTAALVPATLAAPNFLIKLAQPAQASKEGLMGMNSKAVTPATAANQAALDDRDGNLSKPKKRDNTHLYVCRDPNFTGRCQNFEATRGVCYEFTGIWDKEISSLGPDRGAVCSIWDRPGCLGKSLSLIMFPGMTDLGGEWDDRARSFKCL